MRPEAVCFRAHSLLARRVPVFSHFEDFCLTQADEDFDRAEARLQRLYGTDRSRRVYAYGVVIVGQ